MSSIYKQASEVLAGLLKREGGLKTLAFSKHIRQNKNVYALVSQTLKYREIIGELFQTCRVPAKTRTRALLYIMAYDLLFSKRQKIQGGGKLKQILAQKESTLRTALSRLMIRRGVADVALLIPEELRGNLRNINPRYVRVNTLKTSIEAAERALAAHEGLSAAAIKRDSDIPNLLRLPPGTDLHAHKLVSSGALILQDKASCFPAEVLLGPCGDSDRASACGAEWMRTGPFDVIDACAAPGNKTSHLAMLLETNSERKADGSAILAFDKSKPRMALLARRMKQAGADKVVQVSLQDFLATNPTDPRFARVKAMLLDPSCSGSGMASRLDHRINGKSASVAGDGASIAIRPTLEEAPRVAKLANFQISCLAHALKFPALRRFTYSTCSVYEEENEVVVSEILRLCQKQHEDEEGKRANGDVRAPFRLERALPSWHRRGYSGPSAGAVDGLGVHPENKLSEDDANCLCRVMPAQDEMNGFFLACFTRDVPAAVTSANNDGAAASPKKRKRPSAKQPRAQHKQNSACPNTDAAKPDSPLAGGDSASASTANSDSAPQKKRKRPSSKQRAALRRKAKAAEAAQGKNQASTS